ncbi:hypothetical protein [Mycolicibacterium phocaicum]|uniref:hypothetical protein n=1 Tax=Mycolicibacterium phocaicum TaxID=319706 RepID=UPI0010FED3D2|nr:hypothetical protein [Mycolicibacterium phocaicum]TXH25161.1 MAG: hypothetical protein E6R06_10090 [Mycobacterium sp.]
MAANYDCGREGKSRTAFHCQIVAGCAGFGRHRMPYGLWSDGRKGGSGSINFSLIHVGVADTNHIVSSPVTVGRAGVVTTRIREGIRVYHCCMRRSGGDQLAPNERDPQSCQGVGYVYGAARITIYIRRRIRHAD